MMRSFDEVESVIKFNYSDSVADLGGGGRPPQGFDALSTQKVPVLYYFEISIFG